MNVCVCVCVCKCACVHVYVLWSVSELLGRGRGNMVTDVLYSVHMYMFTFLCKVL